MLPMTIAQIFLAEFDAEMRNTRRMLECIRDEILAFQPHPKSMTLRRLAGHISEMPAWGAITVKSTELDIRPVHGRAFEPFEASTCAETLAFFDRNVAEAKKAIAGTSDAALQATWTLLARGEPLFAMPRSQVLKSMVLNHIIHHRAQLSVYLRMKDVPIPGMYGPSADDQQPA